MIPIEPAPSKRRLAALTQGDLVEIEGRYWAVVHHVPTGFPWLVECLTIDSGWPIHWQHISAVSKR